MFDEHCINQSMSTQVQFTFDNFIRNVRLSSTNIKTGVLATSCLQKNSVSNSNRMTLHWQLLVQAHHIRKPNSKTCKDILTKSQGFSKTCLFSKTFSRRWKSGKKFKGFQGPARALFIKMQIGLTFLLPTYPGCPGKEVVKRVSSQSVLLWHWQFQTFTENVPVYRWSGNGAQWGCIVMMRYINWHLCYISLHQAAVRLGETHLEPGFNDAAERASLLLCQTGFMNKPLPRLYRLVAPAQRFLVRHRQTTGYLLRRTASRRKHEFNFTSRSSINAYR